MERLVVMGKYKYEFSPRFDSECKDRRKRPGDLQVNLDFKFPNPKRFHGYGYFLEKMVGVDDIVGVVHRGDGKCLLPSLEEIEKFIDRAIKSKDAVPILFALAVCLKNSPWNVLALFIYEIALIEVPHLDKDDWDYILM